jgi:hypothetical protein
MKIDRAKLLYGVYIEHHLPLYIPVGMNSTFDSSKHIMLDIV